MLYEIFANVLNMGITASVVIVAVVIVRGVMYRLPKKYSYILWLIVGIRLLCPIGIASPVSLFNIIGEDLSIQTQVKDISQPEKVMEEFPDNNSSVKQGTDLSKDGVSEVIFGEDATQSSFSNQNNLKQSAAGKNDVGNVVVHETLNSVVKYGAWLWIGGMFFMLLFNLIVFIRVKHHVVKAARMQGNVYECDDIPSPFVMGIVQPKIYIPFRLGEGEREYILSHERYHIRRKDHIVKIVAFFLSSIYWFHPLVWWSYSLMIRDMEMSCDEYVLQNETKDIRTDYSKSLLQFATNRRNIMTGMLAFGETDTKRRVKHVLNFQKCRRWIGVVAMGIILIAGAVCLTDAKKDKADTAKDKKKFYEDVVSKAAIHGYDVEVKYISEKKLPRKEDLEFGMYAGKFQIQTRKDGKEFDQYDLTLSDEMYFPADGFNLALADYDGDGVANDFALGQGQTPNVMSGNYMRYEFFGVGEDGAIIVYKVANEEGELVTIPGGFSKKFDVKDGVISYQRLGEDGVEKDTTNLYSVVPIHQISEKQGREQKIWDGVQNTMPQDVVEEIAQRGSFHISGGENKTYSLTNETASRESTLRLDFSYSADTLMQYVSKEYGFVDALPEKEEKTDAVRMVIQFASEFCNVKLQEAKTHRDGDYLVIEKDGDEGTGVWQTDTPEKWNDSYHAYFKDDFGGEYLVDLRVGMVVRYERTEPDMPTQTSVSIYDVQFEMPNQTQNIRMRRGENYREFVYYDLIAQTDVTLRCCKKKYHCAPEIMQNAKIEGYWSYFRGNKEHLITICYGTDAQNKQVAILNWQVQGVRFWMYANLEGKDYAKLAKDAAQIAGSLIVEK